MRSSRLSLGALAFLLTACSQVGGESFSALPIQPSPSPFQPGESPPPGFLFQDDFVDPLSGWDVRRDDNAATDYQGGEFVIFVGKPSTAVWSTPHRYMTDVSIEVDARQAAGPDDNLYGLICRYQDRDNFYRFVVGGNGFAGVTKRSQGTVTVISGDYLAVSDAVVRGMASNHLKAVCQGTQLIFYVNGALVAQANDADFQAGDTGLLAAAGSHTGVEIHFTNYTVNRP